MFDIESWIKAGGVLVVALIIMTETGLPVGFILPGTSLLFSAGLMASQGFLPLGWLLFFGVLATVIGGNIGYSIGRRAGRRIFKKEDSLLFHKDHLARAEKFYERHGGKTVTLARFLSVIRTFAPIVAGVGKMPRHKFMFYNVLGAVAWVGTVTLLGYWFGARIPHLDEYIEFALPAVVVISLVAALAHVLSRPKTRRIFLAKIKLGLRSVFLNRKID